MSDPIWTLGACELARRIRNGDLTSLQVVSAHLERIESVNGVLNAAVRVVADEALDAARAADAALAEGAAAGPLHGVPVTIKENFDVAGMPTTHGIVGLKNSIATADAPVVAHLKRAGAIPVARTNLPCYGLRWHTDNDLYGPTRNPWNPALTPGGSSGGEAAAIAAGLSPLGLGNDMGGSLRYPAQCCGIAALKPGLGRVSRIATSIFSDPPTFYSQIAAVNGPMARHVRDLRLALQVLEQRDPADPWWTPAAQRTPAGQIRVAVCANPGGHGVAPSVADAVRRAADILADAGYAIEEAEPPMIREASATLEAIANAETIAYLPEMMAEMSADGGKILEWIIGDTEAGEGAYMMAIAERHRIAQAWSEFMACYPLILGPVSAFEPFAVGDDIRAKSELRRFIRSIELTEACNLLGLPSVAVPVGLADGVPQGVQIIGWRFAETLCLDAADAIERAEGTLTPIDPVGC